MKGIFSLFCNIFQKNIYFYIHDQSQLTKIAGEVDWDQSIWLSYLLIIKNFRKPRLLCFANLYSADVSRRPICKSFELHYKIAGRSWTEIFLNHNIQLQIPNKTYPINCSSRTFGFPNWHKFIKWLFYKNHISLIIWFSTLCSVCVYEQFSRNEHVNTHTMKIW